MTIITHLKITSITTFLSGLIYWNLLNFSCPCEDIYSFEVVPENLFALNQSPSGLSIEVEMLTQRHKVLGCLNNVFSISAKNLFNFFTRNFILFLCFTYQKAMCYVSLEFPALKLKQGSTMIAHKGTMFFLLEGCVRYNFACLFFMSQREHL